ncbi:hypothetical protein APHWI1_0696 [Anaplasma phagocytophilum str. ApWI1]|uniref:Uncharacterized protein n=2 Tax=Anaplasma phagocytophilum TaxID=948 RepID=A0A0F3MUR7_ANAPH|nr:hypothetical protein EPHNCH_1502 [Anaplasma phagocytophilum str. NCH-1]KJV59715.1 hypothetical protein APHWEB_0821 [Anaplasma phagocytophilum str. Webster]KJV83202.1 hypothetical protein APHHGE2_1492 [Anaplasma phagocytophilum str. HGE2]KJV85335.1 hypothetical protein APHWI1_0696 [Anaplasma phagocytophilum str. ApWI1]KJV86841.1 hypothetical protein APHNYW_1205 [Anaplasma phagocytophilum str. ApNYW]KJV98005.1 hypothetical protein OTSANNIE_1467 [Anaplasma phagocytophilum str. Annie]
MSYITQFIFLDVVRIPSDVEHIPMNPSENDKYQCCQSSPVKSAAT